MYFHYLEAVTVGSLQKLALSWVESVKHFERGEGS